MTAVDRGRDEHDQPMPVPNGRPSIQALVRADLDQREQIGIQRYRTTLQPFNGREALLDAYDEATDLVIYLRQVIEEERLALAEPLPPLVRIRAGETAFTPIVLLVSSRCALTPDQADTVAAHLRAAAREARQKGRTQ